MVNIINEMFSQAKKEMTDLLATIGWAVMDEKDAAEMIGKHTASFSNKNLKFLVCQSPKGTKCVLAFSFSNGTPEFRKDERTEHILKSPDDFYQGILVEPTLVSGDMARTLGIFKLNDMAKRKQMLAILSAN